jgi:hypothetical protein
MKKNKISLFVLGILFMLTSCETLKEPTVEYGPVYPLSGEWIVRFINPAKTIPDTTSFITVTTANDASNSTTSLWVRKTGTSYRNTDKKSTTPLVRTFTAKATCNVADKTFSANAVQNTVLSAGVSVGTCTITEGKVIIDGWNTNSGHKSDKITFKYADSRFPGIVYTAEGYRRTGWYEDEP